MINQRFKNFQQSQTLQRFFEAARCHCQPCTHYCSLSLSMAQRLYNVVKSFTCMCGISSTLVCRGCPLRSGLVLLTCCPGPLLYVFMPNLFILKPPPAACDNARKVDDKAHLHCELMYHDYVTLCGRRRCALPPRPPPRLFILEPPPAACDKMQVYDTAHLLFQACVIKLVVKIQVRALLPCCDKTTKVDDMAHQLLRLVLRYRCML